MKYNMTAAAVAGALLALGAAGTAHAATPHADTTHSSTDKPTHKTNSPKKHGTKKHTPQGHHTGAPQQQAAHPAPTPAPAPAPAHRLSTDDAGQLLTSADKVTSVLRHGTVTRGKSLIDSGPRHTGMDLAGLPLGVSRPD